MGKVILEFDSVEEQDEVKTALDGYKWKLSIWDLDQKLRSITKYGESLIKDEASEIEIDVAIAMREELRNVLSSYNLNLED
jgi:hypothetical protein